MLPSNPTYERGAGNHGRSIVFHGRRRCPDRLSLGRARSGAAVDAVQLHRHVAAYVGHVDAGTRPALPRIALRHARSRRLRCARRGLFDRSPRARCHRTARCAADRARAFLGAVARGHDRTVARDSCAGADRPADSEQHLGVSRAGGLLRSTHRRIGGDRRYARDGRRVHPQLAARIDDRAPAANWRRSAICARRPKGSSAIGCPHR